MSIIDRLRGAWRGFRAATGGLSDFRNPTAWLINTLGGMKLTAGVTVTPETSLTVGAYFRALALVSSSVAKMPIRVIRTSGDSREIMDAHPVARLLNRPNIEMTRWDFIETMTHYVMGHGNGIAVIERDLAGNPIALWPRPPSEFALEVDRNEPLGSVLRVLYKWNNADGTGGTRYLLADDVLHLKGMGSGVWGYSVANHMARTTGEAIAQSEHAGGFFGNAARPGGILSHPGALTDASLTRLRESFESLYKGSENSYKTMVLEEGASWAPMTMPMEDAQFLEQRKFSVTEVARWFGIPPHKLGDLEHATFSNIEHQTIEFVTDAVMPWACRWEEECKRKLLGPRSGQMTIDFDEWALIRGDSVQAAERVRTLVSTAVMTPDEGRIELGMNPEGSKEAKMLYMQGAMAPLEQLAKEPEPLPPALAPAIVADEEQDSDAGAEDDGAQPAEQPNEEAIEALFYREAARATRREANAVSGAAGKLDFPTWAESWYRRFATQVQTEYRALLRLYGEVDLRRLRESVGALTSKRLGDVMEHRARGDLADWMTNNEPEHAAALAAAMLEVKNEECE